MLARYVSAVGFGLSLLVLVRDKQLIRDHVCRSATVRIWMMLGHCSGVLQACQVSAARDRDCWCCAFDITASPVHLMLVVTTIHTWPSCQVCLLLACRLTRSVTRLHSSSSNISGNTSAAQERRRAVYRNNLWALPHNTATAAATNSSSSSMRVSEAALELWMERELQALLLEDDVTIICAYVKGLVNSFGINVPTAQQQQHQQENRSNLESMRQAATQAAAAMGLSGSSSSGGEHLSTPCGSSSSSTATISSAVAALEGFLFEAAGHFWHELCCYASSGLTVTAWDRVARYVPAAQLQQQLPKQQQHGAGDDCGDGCPDVAAGQPADPQQQQQAGVQPPMFGQQLSVVRDAAAVHEFLVRRQQQQAQQPQPPIPRPPVSAAPITAEPTTAQAVAAAGRIKVPQQGQPTDRRRGSSSSGSSSSREQQQRDSSRGGRHRQRRHSRSRSRRRSSAERHDRSGVRLGPRHEQKHHSNSRQQHRNNSSSSGRHVGTRSTSRSRVSARQRSRQPHRSSRSGLREGHEQVHHTKQSRGQSDRYDAAVNTMGAAAAAVGVSSDAWGGRWGDEGAGVTDLHIAEGYSAAPGAQPYSVSQQQQQLVGWTQPAANDRWQMD